jgi:hypothetical protein
MSAFLSIIHLYVDIFILLMLMDFLLLPSMPLQILLGQDVLNRVLTHQLDQLYLSAWMYVVLDLDQEMDMLLDLQDS